MGFKMTSIHFLSPGTWQHINLIRIYEFYNNKECFILHDVIQNLISKKKSIYCLQPRLVKGCRHALGNSVPSCKEPQKQTFFL